MISILDQFDLRAKKQNFARDAFETIADMKAFSENYLPPVFDCYCYENGLKYRYNVSNDEDPETGKWRVIGEGGGGDLSSYYTKTQTNALLDGKVDKVVGKDLSDENYTSEEKTRLAGLENYDDTELDGRVTANENAITVLNGNDTVTGSVDSKVASCLSDSKDYTDLQVQNAIRQTAIVCDAKPTISGNTITYTQYGNEYTITSDNKTKFYYTSSGVNYTTIWIEGREFTDTVASVDFADYVSKTNDVVSTYTGSEADKTKVPTLASMDALKGIVDTDLAAKFDTSDIQSTITSASGNPVSSSALYTEFAKKVDIDQGTANEGKILQVNASGNLALTDPSALGGDASSVDYTNASYPELNTVKKALDDLIEKVNYVDPAISSFTMTPATDTYEVGASVPEVVFNWAYNKNVLSQTLTDCTLADETVRTATYSTPITANKTFTLSANDGTKSVTATKSVAFKHYIYWGSSAAPSGDYDSAFILALASKRFATNTKGSYSATVGTGEYLYLAYPSSWGNVNSWFIGGFETTTEDCGTIAFTNASGNTTTFRIVRSGRSGLGTVTAEVK